MLYSLPTSYKSGKLFCVKCFVLISKQYTLKFALEEVAMKDVRMQTVRKGRQNLVLYHPVQRKLIWKSFCGLFVSFTNERIGIV